MIWFQLIINTKEIEMQSLSISEIIASEYGYIPKEKKGFFSNSAYAIAYTDSKGLICSLEDNLLLIGECHLHNQQDLIEIYKLPLTATTADILRVAYQKHGADFIHKIIGDFSFVLYDMVNGKIISYRDRLGKYTIFYTQKTDYSVISSDIFLLTPYTSMSNLQQNYFKLFYYTNGFLEQRITPFKDVYRVRKATYVQHFLSGTEKEVKYWDLVNLPSLRFQNKNDYAEELRQRLTAATYDRMADNEHCAVMLSGGLDSTSVYALAQSKYPISSISAVFNELQESDEQELINEVLQMYQKNGYSIPCDNELILSNFPYESPFTFEPVVTAMSHEFTLFTLKFAKSLNFSEILSGFGGDQVLHSSLYITRDYLKRGQIKKLLQTLTEYSIKTNTSALPNLAKYALFPKVPIDILNHLDGLKQFEDYKSYQDISSPAKQMLYFQMQSLSTNYLDRTLGAMTDLNIKHPFLDQRILEYLFQIPSDINYSEDFEKQLLRDAMKEYLPASVLTKLNKTTHLAHMYKSIRTNWNRIYQYMHNPTYIIELGLIGLNQWQVYLNQWRQGVNVPNSFWTLFTIEWWFIQYSARFKINSM